MRSLDDSNFGVTSCGSGALAADGLSFTHTGHTLEPAMQALLLSQVRTYPFPSKPSNFYAPLDSIINTNLSPQPLGYLELAVESYCHHGH